MTRKNSGSQALYELMGRRAAPPAPPHAEMENCPPPVAVESGGSWLSPGRMLHLPVGYLLLGVAIAVAATIGAYIIGYRQASVVVRSEYEQNVLMNAGGGDALTTNDPLMNTTMLESQTGARIPENGFTPIPNELDEQPVSPRNPAGAPGPIFSDPRQPGLNYFILMETSRDGAERVARFCRVNGLDTYAVGRNNAVNYKVIVLPGFEASASGSDPIRALEALIHQVGDKWRREQGGTTDFRDKYPSLYSG